MQFSTKEGAFRETQPEIEALLAKDIVAPPVLQSKAVAKQAKIMVVRKSELTSEAKDKAPKSKVWSDDFDYVEEYAVFGRFKYQAPTNQKKNFVNFLFRLTTNEEQYMNNKKYYGD